MKVNNSIGINNLRDDSGLSAINASPGSKASRLTAAQTKSRSKKESQITKDK